jgi:alkanesulfonate monooxygenase SsuD/methylene tetrahydromethanopterin reductase-like flavin-dependent oxidoreductase (luciferase family)
VKEEQVAKVEFGVYIPSASTGKRTVERAVLAEDLGFDAVWTPDLIDPGLMECMTLSAAIAGATSRIRVGLGVVNFMYRTPQLLLRTLATLDQLSEGRLNIGIGVGVNFSFEQYGLSTPAYGQRVRQLAETLEVMKRHFTEPTLSFDGEFLNFRDVDPRPFPLQQPCPPVLIGGGSARMLALAAKHADMWEIGGWRSYRTHEGEPKLSVVVRKRKELDEICEQMDRDPSEITTVSDFWFTMAGDKDSADAAAQKAKPWSEMYELHGGTPDVIREKLDAYVESGVGHIVLSFLNMARGETPRLFQREVAPAFA